MHTRMSDGEGVAVRPAPAGGRTAAAGPPFVLGPCNRAPYEAVTEFLRTPCPAFNPLLIVGGPGTGKTHLLRSALAAARDQAPEREPLLSSCEEFATQFSFAIQRERVASFRKKYRSAAVLLFDGVHGLAFKPATQEEFLHTLKAYDRTGRRVVLTSRPGLARTEGLSRALVSRVLSGMSFTLQPPDCATRLAILQVRAARRTFPPPPDLLANIAHQPCASPADLLRLFERVCGLRNPAASTIAAVLREIVGPQAAPIDVAEIEAAVAEYFEVRPADLRSERRARVLAGPRSICLYLARTITARSLVELGRHFGGRSHATVLHACRKVERLCGCDEAVRQQVASIRATLQRARTSPNL